MDRRQFLAVAATGAAAAVAGCTGAGADSRADADAEIVGAAPPESADRTIEVSATGEVEADPDQARARIGVEATGDSADAVEAELAERADALRAAFDDLGIPEENVESDRYTIRPEREGDGYRGHHRFRVVVEDVDRVGEVIDAAVAAGADDVGRISFELSDETRAALRDEALDEALANADEEALHVAENRGVAITGTKSVSTRNVDVVPVRADGAALAAEADAADGAGARTDVESGPVTVSASVDVVYGFEDAG